jgi:hypothetical protein
MRWIIQLLRALTSHYPLNTPRASILRLLPEIPEGFDEFVGKNGIRYKRCLIDVDEVSRSLFWFGDFDPWVNIALKRFSRPGSVAIDIGANIGATALVLAKAVGPTGRDESGSIAPEHCMQRILLGTDRTHCAFRCECQTFNGITSRKFGQVSRGCSWNF